MNVWNGVGFGSCCSGVAVGIGCLVCGFCLCLDCCKFDFFRSFCMKRISSFFFSLMFLMAEISQNKLGRTQLILHQGSADIMFQLP